MARVLAHLYSALREAAGESPVELELAGEATVADVLNALAERSPRLRDLIKRFNIIVLDAEGRRLGLGDKVPSIIHVMPPPSGGGVYARIAEPYEDPEKLLIEMLRAIAPRGEESDAGGIAVFIGVVRGINRGARVRELVYEDAGSITERILKHLVSRAASREGVRGAGAIHYRGVRRPGEVTMIVAVAGVSRRDVFPALEDLVESIKQELPIWKLERREDGDYYIMGGEYVPSTESSRKRSS